MYNAVVWFALSELLVDLEESPALEQQSVAQHLSLRCRFWPCSWRIRDTRVSYSCAEAMRHVQ